MYHVVEDDTQQIYFVVPHTTIDLGGGVHRADKCVRKARDVLIVRITEE